MPKLAYPFSTRAVAFGISLLLGSAGCSGAVALEPADRATDIDASAGRNPSAAQSNVGASNADASSDAPACKREPGRTTALASCDVARQFLVVEPMGITWKSGAPWQRNAAGLLHIRYRNDSPTQGISYPSIALSTSDERVEGESGKHLAQDGHFHPDLYGLASCDRQETSHSFVVHDTLPPGTHVKFVLTPAVADGNGISTCGGTLAVVTFDVEVP